MTSPPPPDPPLLGPLLARLRLARGWSQSRIAAELCAASGVPTLSRHEVSRWERQLRVPGGFWLGWLAVVLAVPLDVLVEAAARTRRPGPPEVASSRSRTALLALAQRWLADPHAALPPHGVSAREWADVGAGWAPGAAERPAGAAEDGEPAAGDHTAVRLAELRRLDDLCGGTDLIRYGAYRTGRVARALSVGGSGARRRLLPLLADSAQLTGWLAADAGDVTGGLDAYRLALRAAAAAGDVALAGHVLGSASHLLSGVGDPAGALLLARTAYAGTRHGGSPGLRALLLHRVALAAALGGRVGLTRRALDAARRVTDAPEPAHEPPWLYWLDGPELAAMTGRTLVASGRPGPAEPLLEAARRRGGPRDAAVYGGWLARGQLQLGEVERACAVADEALLDAVRAGSVRAARQVAELRRRMGGYADAPAVRRFRAAVARAGPYLPRTPSGPGRPDGHRSRTDRAARRAPGGTPGTGATR